MFRPRQTPRLTLSSTRVAEEGAEITKPPKLPPDAEAAAAKKIKLRLPQQRRRRRSRNSATTITLDDRKVESRGARHAFRLRFSLELSRFRPSLSSPRLF